ncbi:hypothetical protein P154DRAFT_559818 [Amniculicola lignicola CBS 123094]|uniref:SCP domain-containing protein n=1 Tax=Amniculicola lignicola CBS 123094 TaxID=1392246 RepID=A0A6A5X1K9_9PLEO|nr:hypothetical protein P154DRAFT_559818 [Amniculicola lignicola CBS 123094]
MKASTLLALATAGTAAAAPAAAPAAVQVLRRDELPSFEDQRFISTVMNAHWYWRKIHCAQDLNNLSAVVPAPGKYEDWLEFARTAIHGWHEEEPKYPYDNPHYEDAWGHFTQMVWRDTSRMGCALAHCDDTIFVPGRIYCFYENAGNNIAGDEFAKNVWRPVCPDPTRIRKIKG